MKRLKVAYIQHRDADDIRNWSGTLYFSRAAIDRHVGRVVDLSPAPVNLLPFRAARRAILGLTGKVYSYDHDPALARYYGWYFGRLIERERPDLIFSPAGSPCLAYLRTDVPVLYFTDGPWRVIRDYNPAYSNVLERSARAAERLERRTLQRAAVTLVSSRWAAESAVRDYGVDPGRVYDVGIGANLLRAPDRAEALPRRIGDRIRLLMVGVVWDAKGGGIAYDTLLRLLERGCDAELTVVGCTAPPGVSHPRVRVIPFLNKQVPEERARFERLWKEADFFVLPTRAEAAGVVFCEASAHGIPSIATHTGGVPSLVVDGRNGYTLPYDAGGEEYARVIAGIAAEPERYARLCETSREEYERRLNWDAWGERVAEIVAERFPQLRGRAPAEQMIA
ncbi:MAG TPA: glycosyltransferase family 4 protein [Longimicrobiaceae bacterium]|nr:glycosyltransferase family 4 protein [Longimicrobiaceae bacterium]